MVAPVRDLGNKFFFSSANTHSQQAFDSTLPTVSSLNHTEMDSSTEQLPVFNFEVRGRTPTSAINLSRESLVASSGRKTPYHGRMDDNMDCDSTIGDSTPELSYETEQEKVLYVSKAADQQEPMRSMGGNNEAPRHIHHMRKVLLTYSFLTIHRLLLSQNYGMDYFTPYHFIVRSSISHWTQRTSRSSWISW